MVCGAVEEQKSRNQKPEMERGGCVWWEKQNRGNRRTGRRGGISVRAKIFSRYWALAGEIRRDRERKAGPRSTVHGYRTTRAGHQRILFSRAGGVIQAYQRAKGLFTEVSCVSKRASKRTASVPSCAPGAERKWQSARRTVSVPKRATACQHRTTGRRDYKTTRPANSICSGRGVILPSQRPKGQFTEVFCVSKRPTKRPIKGPGAVH
jgi:hypothetical protein